MTSMLGQRGAGLNTDSWETIQCVLCFEILWLSSTQIELYHGNMLGLGCTQQWRQLYEYLCPQQPFRVCMYRHIYHLFNYLSLQSRRTDDSHPEFSPAL